jgi:hypothetical protein
VLSQAAALTGSQRERSRDSLTLRSVVGWAIPGSVTQLTVRVS